MVAGPYTSGPASRAENLAALNRAGLALFHRGHVPPIGVKLALPVIVAAGEASFDGIMMPLSLGLAERRDACLRVGGPSSGADAEVARFVARGLPVWHRPEDVPEADDLLPTRALP